MTEHVTAAAMAVLARILPRKYNIKFHKRSNVEEYFLEVTWGSGYAKNLGTSDEVLRFAHSVMNESN